jgi:hypothetical protein
MKLTTHPNVVPRLRMHGAILLLLHVFMVWGLVNHRNNFAFTSTPQPTVHVNKQQFYPTVWVSSIYTWMNVSSSLMSVTFLYFCSQPHRTWNYFVTYSQHLCLWHSKHRLCAGLQKYNLNLLHTLQKSCRMLYSWCLMTHHWMLNVEIREQKQYVVFVHLTHDDKSIITFLI